VDIQASDHEAAAAEAKALARQATKLTSRVDHSIENTDDLMGVS